MAQFPLLEVEISELATIMMAGYEAHVARFPSANMEALTAAYAGYSNAHNAHIEAHAAARVATEAKNAALDVLKKTMQGELKKSEADTANDPEELEYIGWGPRVSPTHAQPPGQPRNLDLTIQNSGTILLDWKSAVRGSSGAARSYIIERREEPAGGGEFGPWTQIGVAIESEATLTNQPRGVELEYRVIAINKSGDGPPSNTVTAVL